MPVILRTIKKTYASPGLKRGWGNWISGSPTHRHSTRRAGGGREESPTLSQFLNCMPAKT